MLGSTSPMNTSKTEPFRNRNNGTVVTRAISNADDFGTQRAKSQLVENVHADPGAQDAAAIQKEIRFDQKLKERVEVKQDARSWRYY